MAEIGVILFILGGLCLPIGVVVWIIRAIMKKSTTKNMKFTCISMAAIIIGFALVVMSPTEESSESVINEEVVSNEQEPVEVFEAESQVDNLEYASEAESKNEEMEYIEEDTMQPEEEYEETVNDAILTMYKEYIYPFSEFPYENRKMSKKAMKLYEDAMEAEDEEFIFLEEKSKGGIITEKAYHYKKTIDTYDAQYRYYGKLNRNNEPDGMGIIIQDWSDNYIVANEGYQLRICYIGEFKDGYKNGYGIEYNTEEYTVKYEGEYKEGKYDGEGTLFSYVLEDDCNGIIEEWAWGEIQNEPRQEYQYLFEGFGENMYFTYPVIVATKDYSGEFKDGKFHGEGKSYFGVDEDNQPFVIYEGEFRDGDKEGKGKSYYFNGELCYKGEFKNGKYHGKGTLYDEDGKVKHKGKFKNGDIE